MTHFYFNHIQSICSTQPKGTDILPGTDCIWDSATYFVNTQPAVLSESEAYKFRGCEGRAVFQARNGAERNFVYKTMDELRTVRAVNEICC